MIKFLKRYWANLVSSLDPEQPLLLTKEMLVQPKPKRLRFKKVKRLRVRGE